MDQDLDPFVDRPRAVRKGEELNLERLAEFLAGHVPGLSGPLTAEQFPRGHSNLTYLVRTKDRELVLRRPPRGASIRTAHDMGREHRILAALAGVYPLAPRPLASCEDPAVLGAPFYIMERVRGVILRGPRPPAGLDLAPEKMGALCASLVDNLAALHAVDLQATGLGDLGRPEGYVERQVGGWTERYENARTDEVPQVEEAAAWLARHRPPESGATLIHNDYKYDNLVLDPLDPTRILAVLDWEMATVGDPLMDLGTTLGYWVDPDDPDEARMLAQGPTLLSGNLSRMQVAERYARATGRDLAHLVFYYVYALFKIAVIAQQIYRRFKEGATTDPRFGMMIVGVRLLGQQAVRAMERGRIYNLGG